MVGNSRYFKIPTTWHVIWTETCFPDEKSNKIYDYSITFRVMASLFSVFYKPYDSQEQTHVLTFNFQKNKTNLVRNIYHSYANSPTIEEKAEI